MTGLRLASYSTIKYIALNIVISLAVIFLAQIFATSFDLAISFIQHSVREWLFTSIAIILIFLISDCLLGRKYISIGPVTALILSLSVVSGQKYGYRSEPLYPWDFLFTNQVMDLLPILLKERPSAALAIVTIGTASIILLVAIVYFFAKQKKLSTKIRFKIGATSLVALAIYFYSISPFGTLQLYKATGIMNMAWDQSINYPKNGFLLAFSFSVNSALVEKPKVDLEAALLDIKSAPKASPPTSIKPDIIIVMNESFWDPTKLPGSSFTPDPMPTVRALQRGEIFSPVYGGGTANVEFEALTGFSNTFLPTGSLPYQQYVKRNTPSIIWALKNFGYKSVAIHPYHRWFWNRESVYSKFGFDRFISLEQMPPDKNRGLFFSDEELSKEILEEIEKSDQPTIVFAVTMQNHGPYEKLRYPTKHISIHSSFDIGIAKEEGLQTYSDGISDGDNGLKILVSELSKRSRPTLLIFFGDHLPMMGQNFEVFKETGFVTGSPNSFSIPELKRIRTTPLVVWSNSINIDENQGIISPSFIPNIIDHAVGLDNPFYGQFLGNLRKQYNVIDQKILGNVHGSLEKDWRSQSIEIIDRYQAIQYDLMFGKETSANILFPGFDKVCCSNSNSSSNFAKSL